MSANRPVPYSSENHARQALIETCLQFAPLGLNQGSRAMRRSAGIGALKTACW